EIYFCKKLVNAAGPWIDQVRAAAGEKDPWIEPVAGCHIHVKKFLEHSVILQAEDKRVFFVVNRSREARIGTTERPCDDPDHVMATEGEIDYLLKSVNYYFPEKKFSRADIVHRDAGVRPLVK